MMNPHRHNIALMCSHVDGETLSIVLKLYIIVLSATLCNCHVSLTDAPATTENIFLTSLTNIDMF